MSNILGKKEVIENKQIFGRAAPLSPAVLSNISAIISMNSVLISKIVDTFGGFLIYSGGDDALALLPPEITHIVYILLILAFLLTFRFSKTENEWTYIKCLKSCNQGINIPRKLCNYEIVQKLIDHGRCFWDISITVE